MAARKRSRQKQSPAFETSYKLDGGVHTKELIPTNRAALRQVRSIEKRGSGVTNLQHQKEKRKQRLKKLRRVSSKLQKASRKLNRK